MKVIYSSAAPALLSFALVLVGGCTIRVGSDAGHTSSGVSENRSDAEKIEMDLPHWAEPITDTSPVHGTWKTSGRWFNELSQESASNRWIHLQFRGRMADRRHLDFTALGIRASEFRVVDRSDDSQAGQIVLAANLSTARLLWRGERNRGEATGALEITPDATFLKRGGELLEGDLTLGELLRFGMRANPLEYIELVCANKNKWTWSEVLQLQQRGVDPQFIRALRTAPHEMDKPSAPLMRLDRPARAFSAEEIVLLHSRGVSVDYIEKINAAVSGMKAHELVLLHSRGVSTEFVREVMSSGMIADANDLVLMFSRGVPPGYIVTVRTAGYNYTSEDLVFLYSRGVPAQYLEALRRAGYDYSSHNVVLLYSRGVPAEYLSEIADSKYRPLGASEVVRLYTAGVPVETVKRLRK